MKKRVLILIVIIIMSFNITACDPVITQRQMNNILYTTTTGIDIAENIKDGVKIIYVVTRPDEEERDGLRKLDFFVGEGKTTFNATRNMRPIVNGSLFGGSSKYLIIGEAVAKDCLYKYVDHQLKDHDIRLNIQLFIAKDTTSTELIMFGDTPDQTFHDALDGLIRNIDGKSITKTVDIIEFMKILVNENRAPLIPSVEINSIRQGTLDLEGKPRIKLGGYGVIRNDKLIGYLSDSESRGVNWITNNIEANVYSVELDDLGVIGIEIAYSKSKIIPSISDNKLSVKISVDFDFNIGEQSKAYNIVEDEILDKLEYEVEKIVKDEVMSAIHYSSDNNADILGICDAFFHKYPVEWNEIKKDWPMKLKQIKYDVEVNGSVGGSYKFNKPVGIKNK